MMNKNILIVLGGGFVIAILVALMVKLSLGGSKPAPVAVAEPPAMIAVASRALSVGETLDDTNMMWKEWPKTGVVPGSVTRAKKDQTVTEAVSGRLSRAVAEGEPILKSAVVQDRGNFMAATLREGMRAISLDLKGAALLSGFLAPGDYVDVMMTYKGRIRVNNRNIPLRNLVDANFVNYATETIVENVRVLAVDQRMTNDPAQKSTRPAKSVTLEVTPEAAEVLVLARRAGELTMALRRLGDTDVSTEYRMATTDARITNIWDEIYTTMQNSHLNNTGHGNDIVRVYGSRGVNDVTTGQ